MGSKGVVYLAYGIEYLIMAAHSSYTLKMSNPNLKVQVITNVPIVEVVRNSLSIFDIITFIEDDQINNRKIKLSLEKLSNFDKTVFIDSDTEILKDISALFDMLDFWPFALKFNSYYVPRKMTIFDKDVNYLNLSDWNSGVLVFNKNNDYSTNLFSKWRKNYKELGFSQDQPALKKTIYEMRQFPLPLSGEWNAKRSNIAEYHLLNKFREKVYIYHYRDPSRDIDVKNRIIETAEKLNFFFSKSLDIEYINKIMSELDNYKNFLKSDQLDIKKKIRSMKDKGLKHKIFKKLQRIFNYFGFELTLK